MYLPVGIVTVGGLAVVNSKSENTVVAGSLQTRAYQVGETLAYLFGRPVKEDTQVAQMPDNLQEGNLLRLQVQANF